ncbi:flagellar motor protein MotS [Bacillus marinisedimentorum]|uniref:flagellar motor protein MotS n=1 Tax=Bacillus marinisedimentorum TaxID=1821260 RepID=UPI0007DF3F2F|nr:flagellar motor protein MotS [Bacillus marinisedimentorum]
MTLRKKKEQKKKGSPAWMVTYADLMTLILVFFILLFSMSQIDLIKFQAVAKSFNSDSILDANSSAVPEQSPAEKADDAQLDEILAEIRAYLEENGLENTVTAQRNERGVVLVLQERVLFETGEAEIIEAAQPFLNEIGHLLTTLANPVKVEGHTDGRPIHTYRYPSNWELSGARASSVIRYFTDYHGIDAGRFTAIGYGDTRPLAANDNSVNWQKNRRVEIVISDSKNKES